MIIGHNEKNDVIEKYLRDTGIDLCTWSRNGMRVIIPIQEKIIPKP